MNKRKLIDALENYPDEAEIRLWRWTDNGSEYYRTFPKLNNNPDIHPETFDLAIGRLIPEETAEARDQVEFKFKRKPMKWEDMPVFVTRGFNDRQEIEKYAETLSQALGVEVRWNYKGYSQGHYVNVNVNGYKKEQ